MNVIDSGTQRSRAKGGAQKEAAEAKQKALAATLVNGSSGNGHTARRPQPLTISKDGGASFVQNSNLVMPLSASAALSSNISTLSTASPNPSKTLNSADAALYNHFGVVNNKITTPMSNVHMNSVTIDKSVNSFQSDNGNSIFYLIL